MTRKNKSPKFVIGLTGPNGAGKGEVCKFLKEKNFSVFSLSDILREEAKKLSLAATRENLIYLGNKLRQKYGANILASKCIKQICSNSNEYVVVDSIRTPQEIVEFKKKFKNKFVLLHIDAPLRLRYKFIKLRNRPGDPKSYKEFLEIEKKEKSKHAVQQQIHKCKLLSDFFIYNNKDLTHLHSQINKILKIIGIDTIN